MLTLMRSSGRKGPIGIGSATASVRGRLSARRSFTFAIGAARSRGRNGGFVSEAKKRTGRKSSDGGRYKRTERRRLCPGCGRRSIKRKRKKICATECGSYFRVRKAASA